MPIFKKIRPVVVELFSVDRRTDMMKLTVAFRNFANAPKMTDKSCLRTQNHKSNGHSIWITESTEDNEGSVRRMLLNWHKKVACIPTSV